MILERSHCIFWFFIKLRRIPPTKKKKKNDLNKITKKQRKENTKIIQYFFK